MAQFKEIEGIGPKAFDMGLYEVDGHIVPEGDDGCLIDHELVHPAVDAVPQAVIGFEEGGFIEPVEFRDARAGIVGGRRIPAVENTQIVFGIGIVSDPAAPKEECLVSGDAFEEAGTLHGFDLDGDAYFFHLPGDECTQFRIDGYGIKGDRLQAPSAWISGFREQPACSHRVIGVTSGALFVEAGKTKRHEAVFRRKSDGIAEIKHHLPSIDRMAHRQPHFEVTKR